MYKTINGWTVDSIIKHIKENFKGRSKTEEGSCLYRGPDGKKCAVGMFIPDDLYDPSMDGLDNGNGTGITSVLRQYPILMEHMPIELKGLIQFQFSHDDGRINEDRVLDNIINWVKTNVKD